MSIFVYISYSSPEKQNQYLYQLYLKRDFNEMALEIVGGWQV